MPRCAASNGFSATPRISTPIGSFCSAEGIVVSAIAAANRITASIPLNESRSAGQREGLREPFIFDRIAGLPRPDQSDGGSQKDSQRDRREHPDSDRISRERSHDALDTVAPEDIGRRDPACGGDPEIAARGDEALVECKCPEHHEIAMRQIKNARRSVDQHVAKAEQRIEAAWMAITRSRDMPRALAVSAFSRW